jgi:two-component system LytT family response regulator
VIRTVIVDDEPLAREGMRLLLAEEPDILVVAEAADGLEAVETIRMLRPDLVLLDVQMPEVDGFEVVRRVAEEHLPVIVFVSAHDRFALRAFEVHALDYLLKPVSRERLRDGLGRVRQELSRADRDGARALSRLVAEPLSRRPEEAPPSAPLRRFAVKDGDRYLLLRADEVQWIEAAGNYVGLHARGKVFLMRSTLADLARGLDADRFARIHRSTIVNVDRVAEIVPDGSGDFLVKLRTGEVLTMSRTYRDELLPRG